MPKEKNLQLERLIFFSDAVVAIAITLLALDLKIEHNTPNISFEDIGRVWPKFIAFLLSFMLISVFWKVHHEFFALIKKIDTKLFWYNIYWLLFIVTIPFSTTVVSGYFNQPVSVFIYSLNTLLVTIFQNQIWDYVADKPEYLNEKATPELIYDNQFNCNVAMGNALLAAVLAFIVPVAAFLVLFTRPLMMWGLRKIFKFKAEKKNRGVSDDVDG